jgi:hypothetical protein
MHAKRPAPRGTSTKKASRKPTDELRREYKRSDFGTLVRGKYARRLSETTNVVVLEPEVAKAFPNDRAVNRALRKLIGKRKSTPQRTRKRAARSGR